MDRIAWEHAWAAATGRPWGWVPPTEVRLSVQLDPKHAHRSRVTADGVDLPVMVVETVTKVGDVPLLKLVLPMYRADVRIGGV